LRLIVIDTEQEFHHVKISDVEVPHHQRARQRS
jgi:hypothetical protein